MNQETPHQNKMLNITPCKMCGAQAKIHPGDTFPVFCSSDCRMSQQQEDDIEFY